MQVCNTYATPLICVPTVNFATNSQNDVEYVLLYRGYPCSVSWKETGLSWGNEEEVIGLQTCIRSLVDKPVRLINVIQVMLVRRILPCQRRSFNMWEFDPAEHQTLHELFNMTHKDVWKVLFMTGEVPPPTSEDRGLSAKRLANPVSPLSIARCI